ncbi:MAG TPA: hypothetical protein ENL17_00900 [Candidatus Methanoperedenaceae archaeon]|nr:hypothetical protein [Candidatus Methanoperedenaceae archaeon]
MDDTDHIFNPRDDSLSERMRVYGLVAEAYRNAEASLKYLDDDEISAQLGERREVERAYKICKRSFQLATNAITQDELQEAKTRGLINEDEIRELEQKKRMDDMQALRDNQNTDSREHSNKQ